MLTFVITALIAAQPLRLAVLGDRTGGADSASWQATIRAVELMRPDLVVSVGDLIEGYCDSAEAIGQWTGVLEGIRPLRRFGLVATPGNHDIWSPASEEVWATQTGWPVEGVVRRPGVDLVVWDTSRKPRLSPELLRGLDSLLTLPRDTCTVLLTHKPLWAMAESDSLLSQRFYAMVERHGVDVVLSGHVHAAACQRRGGVLLATVGSSGTLLRRESVPQGLFTHFGWLTLGGGEPGLALIGSRAVHPESLNLPVEQNLHYLCTRGLMDPEALTPEGGHVDVVISPVEGTIGPVTVTAEPEGWSISPMEAEVSVEDGPDTLRLRADPGEELLPLPRLVAGVRCGPRDKWTQVEVTVPLSRPVPLGASTARTDGRAAPGEYPGEPMTELAGRWGGPAGVPPVRAWAACDGDSLWLAIVCRGNPEGDEAGAMLFDGEASRLISSSLQGGAYALVRRPGHSPEEWSDGWLARTGEAEGGWTLELAVCLDDLQSASRMRMNLFRSCDGAMGCWSWPLSWDGSLMGPLIPSSVAE